MERPMNFVMYQKDYMTPLRGHLVRVPFLTEK